MTAQSQELGYGEIIEWARMLGHFTASDLARELGVSHEIGVRAVNALCRQGICCDTEDPLNGPYGPEPIIQYVPIPQGHTARQRRPTPEREAVTEALRIETRRGEPVRARSRAGDNKLSVTGRRRRLQKQRDAEYERQQAARLARARRGRK